MKPRNDVKSGCFVLYRNLCHSSVKFENIDFKFCTHVHPPLPFNINSVFQKLYFEGELWGKMMKIRFFLEFGKFENFELNCKIKNDNK